MNKLFPLVSLLCLLILAPALSAQNSKEILYVNSADEASYSATVDSSLVKTNIFSLLSVKGKGSVQINQSDDIRKAVSNQISANASKRLKGYRIRIFFDNSQNARAKSESVAASFHASYPNIRVYRSHENPYFKVTVGDFRTKAEAQKFANKLAKTGAYPYTFLVSETINYPNF